MATKSFYVKESELDDYQVRIINKRTDKPFIVKGCAGSGKSILALWKAKQIQDEGKDSFLIVVLTKSLKQYMLDGIKQIGIDSKNVESFNKCFCWSKEDGEWVRGVWKHGVKDYIIVDEAQDFSEEEIQILASKASKALLLYGDSAQQLYAFKNAVASLEHVAATMKIPMEQLVFNHRLPKLIAKFVQYISGIDDDLEGRCKALGVEKPKIFEYGSFKEELNAIIEIIKNRNFDDVGILVKDNSEVKLVQEYFAEHGINCEAKCSENMELNFNSDNPKIMTYHSSKGLQFEAVFLPNCVSSDNNPLYVALTRTYQYLYVTHSGNLSPLFNDVPQDTYETKISDLDLELL